MFSVVFIFCVSFLKERDCSLRLCCGRARQLRTKRNEPAFRADGRRSGQQCSDTNYFVARNCSGATRSAESRRTNTKVINAEWNNIQPAGVGAMCPSLAACGWNGFRNPVSKPDQLLKVRTRPHRLLVPQMPERRHSSWTIWLWSTNRFTSAP